MSARIYLPASVVCLVILTVGVVTAQPAELPKVTINPTEATVSELMGEISSQTEVKIYLGEVTDARVEVDLHEAGLEAAIHAVCEPATCSWVRVYLLEPEEGPVEEYDFASVVRMVMETRRQQFEGMTQEQREAAAQQASQEAMAADAAKDKPDSPVGGWRATTAIDGTGEAFLDRTARWAMSDPLRFAASIRYTDPVTLQVTEASLAEFTTALSEASGFIVVQRLGGVETLLTIDATDAPVDEIVAMAAEQLGCSWRRVYLVAHVRQLTDEQIEQRMEGMMHAGMGMLWSQPPERRAEFIQRAVEGAERLTPEQRSQIRSSRLARKMMDRFLQYANTLTMEQRREIMPLLQQAAKIMGG